MSGFLFVGERPSKLAHEKGWTWESGRLAAKQLFDALHACGVEPTKCGFVNLFGEHPQSPLYPSADRLAVFRAAAAAGVKIVAMGNRVASWLKGAGIPHRMIRHPAARGAGRKKELYAQHVREVLL